MRTAFLWLLLLVSTSPAAEPAADAVNWPEFLARHDLVWERLPRAWSEGAFLGNGLCGAMIYGDGDAPLTWEIGRSDVFDHRSGPDVAVVSKARLPIGSFALHPVGQVQHGTMRLDLWNAEATGELTTDRGSIKWRSLVHAHEPVVIVELEPTAGEAECRWEWLPAVSQSSRVNHKGVPRGYKANPPPTLKEEQGCQVCVQPLQDGGQYATAWKTDAGKRVLYASVGNSWPAETAHSAAVAAVNAAAARGLPALVESHRAWWHAYYPQSFLSVPDARLEGFYWIQMYKLGAGSRADGPALDLMGPWYHQSVWPGMWWNLNIQLAYSPVYTANRLACGENFCRMLDDNVANLVNNTKRFKNFTFDPEAAVVARTTNYDLADGMFKGEKGASEVGNLTWACQNYWRQCRYAGDDVRLREKMLPLLRRAVSFYFPLLKKESDGKYHLLPTYSPEFAPAPDCNYDLALLRWGCQTLVNEDQRLALDDPLLPRWKDVLENLCDFPAGRNGLLIGRGVPLDRSHRHYSHLLAIYPLYLITADQPERRPLIEASLKQWTSMSGSFKGYSYTGAASMVASLERGDDALKFLNQGLDRFLTPNTMYMEADSPVIETPLSGAQSLQDMLLQSWGGKIRVFPALPGAWPDVAFRDLRTEGAFLVSAVRQGGKTQFVRIKSLAGEPGQVLIDGEMHELRLARGEEKVFGNPVAISPVSLPPGSGNVYGLKGPPSESPGAP